jgi:hypothetical protein
MSSRSAGRSPNTGLSARFALLVTAPPPVASLPFLDALFACYDNFRARPRSAWRSCRQEWFQTCSRRDDTCAFDQKR